MDPTRKLNFGVFLPPEGPRRLTVQALTILIGELLRHEHEALLWTVECAADSRSWVEVDTTRRVVILHWRI